jgi:prepilin-type N-terminal cleavage/methylation domain-containing protein
MRRRLFHRGFTLLEVLLGLSLAVVVVAGAFAFYKRALEVRELVIQDVEVAGAERAIMDHMTAELRAAQVDSFVCPSLQGSASQIKFGTVVVPGPPAWAVVNATDTPVTPERDLQVVTYDLRPTVDDQGNPILDDQGNPLIDGIERTCQTLVAAQTVVSPTGTASTLNPITGTPTTVNTTPNTATNMSATGDATVIPSTLVSARMKFLYFRYWDGTQWTEAWSGNGLPAAVEVIMGVDPLPSNVLPADYPYAVFHRVVFVPGGAKPPSGTIVLGLDGELP